MQVQFTKRTDGIVILKCVRNDGSETWQRHDKHAVHFSFHDLTHFAVETTLELRSGFYGLIADGWDIADTSGKGKRGKLPAASVLVEHMVGLFDRERSGTPPFTAAEFNAQMKEMAGPEASRLPLTEAQLSAIRNRIRELHQQWSALPAGSTYELNFEQPM